jgi:hypothetical protein
MNNIISYNETVQATCVGRLNGTLGRQPLTANAVKIYQHKYQQAQLKIDAQWAAGAQKALDTTAAQTKAAADLKPKRKPRAKKAAA